MDIQQWLETFIQAWTRNDVDTVLSLFSHEVEYWETPFVKLDTFDRLTDVWRGIRNQKDIAVSIEAYGSSGNAHCIKWNLRYRNTQHEIQIGPVCT
jgi:hypothetical protein